MSAEEINDTVVEETLSTRGLLQRNNSTFGNENLIGPLFKKNRSDN